MKGCARQAEWVFDSVLAHPSPVPILVPVPVRSVPSFALMPSPAPPPLTSLPYPPLPPSLLGFRSYFLQGPLEVSEYPVALPEAVLGRKGASRGRVKRLVRHSRLCVGKFFVRHGSWSIDRVGSIGYGVVAYRTRHTGPSEQWLCLSGRVLWSRWIWLSVSSWFRPPLQIADYYFYCRQ